MRPAGLAHLPHSVDCRLGTAKGFRAQLTQSMPRAHYELAFDIVDAQARSLQLGRQSKPLAAHCMLLTHGNPTNDEGKA